MRFMPLTAAVFRKMGIFPLRNNYYEPQFDMTGVDMSGKVRDLPGIEFHESAQLELLGKFEATDLPTDLDEASPDGLRFSYQNRNFQGGDADLWYHVVRHFKPKRVVEVGSGHSTRMARHAIDKNCSEDSQYKCTHLCIEPYEMPWLEKLGIEIRREKLEDTDLAIFEKLEENDILFIDSSHMIRPGGDVIIEYLQILPRLATGVIVHIHDIFSPREYPAEWLMQPRFWNEQYLLEAFLSHNHDWQILLAGNALANDHPEAMQRSCPYFAVGFHQPGSLYLKRK